MTATYDSIATTTLGSAASTITFSSIPATYTDLRLVLVGSFPSGSRPGFRLNNDSTALYSQTNLVGDGSSASSTRYVNQTGLYAPSSNTEANTMFLFTIDLFSYTAAINKTALFTFYNDLNNVNGTIETCVSLYRSTSAITTFNLITTSGNYNAGTRATLYGIKSE